MSELLTQFGVDWKLLLAQVVNFFILLTILRLFAYKPVLSMLRNRREKIEEGLQASEESKKKLAEAEKREQEIVVKAEQNALALVSQAEQDAKIQEAEILKEAYQKSDHVVALGRKRVEEEAQEKEEEIMNGARDLIKAGVKKVIQVSDVDARLIDQALRELKLISRKS